MLLELTSPVIWILNCSLFDVLSYRRYGHVKNSGHTYASIENCRWHHMPHLDCILCACQCAIFRVQYAMLLPTSVHFWTHAHERKISCIQRGLVGGFCAPTCRMRLSKAISVVLTLHLQLHVISKIFCATQCSSSMRSQECTDPNFNATQSLAAQLKNI